MSEHDKDAVLALRYRRQFDGQNRDFLGEALNELAETEKRQIEDIVRREIKREPEKNTNSN